MKNTHTHVCVITHMCVVRLFLVKVELPRNAALRIIRRNATIQELLVETAKQHGISGKRALAQALVWIMRRDQEEGLAAKKIGVAQSKEEDFRCTYHSNLAQQDAL